MLICWDQWYPEAARITTLLGAQVLFYPTAIGWHPAEKDEWGARAGGRVADDAARARDRQRRLRRVAEPHRPRGRARHRTASRSSATRSSPIRSAATSPKPASARRSSSRSCDPALIETVRRNWPFLRDRRVDAYGPILNRYLGDVSRRPACADPLRMPAEWEPHRATWISWPHHEPDWPGKLGPIPWVYAEIARVLAAHEPVEILCHSEDVRADARARRSTRTASRRDRVRLHVVPTDRVWLRDSAPTGVLDAAGDVVLRRTGRSTAGRSTTTGSSDAQVGARDRAHHRPAARRAARADNGERIVLEGGGIEVNGHGLLLVTEEWLLSDVQVRNPGLDARRLRARSSREWLGVRQTIWLGEGCVGDDTHGHIDDIARFVSRDTVVLAVEDDPADENHARSIDNLRRLERASQHADVGPLRIVTLPFPRPVMMNGERLPASYANFYIANGVVLVPTFNDPNDRVALQHARRADAVTSRRRHPRRRSGVGARHAALPDAAGTRRDEPRYVGCGHVATDRPAVVDGRLDSCRCRVSTQRDRIGQRHASCAAPGIATPAISW